MQGIRQSRTNAVGNIEGRAGEGLQGTGAAIPQPATNEYFQRGSVHNLPWRCIPIQNYSNGERMFEATDFTLL